METILYEKIPVTIAQQLMSEGRVPPQRFEEASVMFAGIHRLRNITDTLTPEEVVDLLNSVFASIDSLIDRTPFDIHKIDVRLTK